MEQAVQVSFDEMKWAIEEESGGHFCTTDEVSRDYLREHNIVHIEVLNGEESLFFILFNSHSEEIRNISAAVEVAGFSALKRCGSIVLSHYME